eukprot:5775978-Pleurochrysis_carterae.AAC.4
MPRDSLAGFVVALQERSRVREEPVHTRVVSRDIRGGCNESRTLVDAHALDTLRAHALDTPRAPSLCALCCLRRAHEWRAAAAVCCVFTGCAYFMPSRFRRWTRWAVSRKSSLSVGFFLCARDSCTHSQPEAFAMVHIMAQTLRQDTPRSASP